MTPEQKKVLEYFKITKMKIEETPTLPDEEVMRDISIQLGQEFDELKEAFVYKDIGEIADALGDLLYIINGAATTCGIDLEPIFNEVHRSNMARVSPNLNAPKIWDILKTQKSLNDPLNSLE